MVTGGTVNNSSTPENNHVIETQLSRDLGLVSALAIGIGTMVAAGIFTLSGLAVGYVGSAAIASFLLAAGVATFTALTYCEFSSIYPQSGEGYLYARRTFPALIAYMVGWCLLLGYTASCGFYISSFASYFSEFIWHTAIPAIPGLFVVAGLTLLNIKGTKESGSFQIVITIGKIILLLWFVAGGMLYIDFDVIIERFSTDMAAIASTSAMVFITFFGFSAIAASAGEVKNPTKTIPQAIFISMGVVTVLYSLVVLVVVTANLTDYSESAMGSAASTFLGPIGGMVIVGGALFSMISASNASIMAGSRVALSMSQLGHLPRGIGTVSERTRTPIVALLLVGVGIGTFSILLPLEDLAHFADCVLLIALVLVNAALIHHRRRFPHLERPFRVPLVPFLPALGILANLYLLTQIPHVLPVVLALGALGLGFLGFISWKGMQVEEEALPGEASRVALERADSGEDKFRVLVPIANPRNVNALIDLAAAIATRHEGHIIVLRVVVLPEQLPPEREEEYVERERKILEKARRRARQHGIRSTSLIRIGHDAARAILETSREREANLIILGWKGFSSTARRILGEVTEKIVSNARTDIMLVKLKGEELPKRLLVPTTGGVHAQQAEEYAADMAAAAKGSLTLFSVVPPEAQDELIESETARLGKVRDRLSETGFDSIEISIVRKRSVSEGIVEESKDYDGVVIGAAEQSFSNKILFGSIPEEVARESTKPVIVIKHHHGVKALFGRVMSE